MITEFNYHLKQVSDSRERVVAEYQRLSTENQKLLRETAGIRKVVSCLPNAEAIVKLADTISRGLPLFSQTQITEIQEGLLVYAVKLRDEIDAHIVNIESAIHSKESK